MTQAPARIDLRGGGSFLPPRGYALDSQKSLYRGSVTVFRRMHSTLGGYVECDGLINVARRETFGTLENFATQSECAATTRWETGNLMPGWTSYESERFPLLRQNGPCGPERVQQLSVYAIGFLRTRNVTAWRVAFDHPGGLMMQVWIFEKHGGLKQACRLAAEVAATFTP